MRFLFDTDTISNLLKRRPSPALLARLALVPVDEQCTSSITVGELVYGAARLGTDGALLRHRIERQLVAHLQIVPFDVDAARHYGELRATLEQQGTPLAEADLRIAAIALTHTLIVVTGNVRHFARVPRLPVENWLI
jgi:tRNA(fMet)-specific endonuclease VapC